MDAEYLKTIVMLLGSASLTGGLFITLRKMFKDYLDRNNVRVMTIRRTGENYSVQVKGLTVKEMMALAKQYEINKSD